MNIGQVMETHLGWAAKALGWHVATPVFDGAEENEIVETLEKRKLRKTAKRSLGTAVRDFPLTVG